MFDNYYINHKTFNIITILFLTKSNSAAEAATLLTKMKYFEQYNFLARDDVKSFFYLLFVKSKKRISQSVKT